MKTDRELRELAAKVSGLILHSGSHGLQRVVGHNELIGCDVMVDWNPLTDDGDALRLAVQLGIQIIPAEGYVEAVKPSSKLKQSRIVVSHKDGGAESATRRAIVMMAAQIGELSK